MNFKKTTLSIIVSFFLGVGASQFFMKGKDIPTIKKTEEHHEDEEEHGLELSKKTQELIDIKVQEAKFAPFVKKISVIGQISQDSESSIHVSAPVSGMLYDCKAKIGAEVEKDEIICVIKNDNSFIEVKSPASGIVISDFFNTGDKVDTISSMHTIADLSKLWATLDVYEKDIANIELGQKIIARSIAYPEKTFEGKITFISPRVDENTHTIKVRAIIQNPGYLLKMGMFINADILIDEGEQYIILPKETVHFINAKSMVFIKVSDETFQAREVKIKDQTQDEVAISSGINEGEYVVAQGGFLLKSELLKSQMGEGCAE